MPLYVKFRMSGEFNVWFSTPFEPLRFLQKLGFGKADCPNADAFFDNMVSFPFQQTLSEDDLRIMIEATKSVLDQLRTKNASSRRSDPSPHGGLTPS